MRRLLYISLLCLQPFCLLQAQNTDPHLKRLIECINDSNFVCAAEELPLVENWTPISTWLTVYHALTFLRREDIQNYPKSVTDSFRLYVAEESNSYRIRYAKRGEYAKALLYAKLTAKYRALVLGTKHPDYAIALSKLGKAFCDIGDYSSAQKYYLASINKAQYFTRDYIYDYETLLNNIGTFYYTIGDYVRAEEYYLKYLLSIEDRQGDLTQAADLLSNLGVLYSSIGDYNKAKEYYLLAIESDSIYEGVNSSSYAVDLNHLGSLYKDIGEYNKAELLYKRALEIRRELGMETYPVYASNLDFLGVLYVKMEKFNEAEFHLMQALKILEEAVGKDNPQYADQLLSMGFLYYKMKEYTTAERYYFEALKIVEEHIGERFTNYSNYIILLNNLSVLYYDIHEYSKADMYLRKCIYYSKELFRNSLTFFSEKQRAYFWETIKDYFEIKTQRLAYRYYWQEPNSTSFAYDNELFRKGILLQSTKFIKQSVIESNDTTLTQIWEEIVNLKLVIDYLQKREPDSEFLPEYQELAKQAEKAIIKSSVEYRENIRQWNITWDSVRAELKPNQVAIEYMSAPLNKDSTMYCALLLRDTCSYPIMIPLFEEKQVTQDREKQAALIWSNVLPYLNAGDEVYFSPTGIIHQIAIENLPYDSTRTMADVYHMVRLSSTRELAMHREQIQHSSAALYGDIAYQEMDATTMMAIASRYNDGTRSAAPARLVDTSQDFEPTTPLPGTKAEIDSIAPILKKQHIAVQVYAQQEACEESVKALSGQKRNILHISTHGFFQPDDGQGSDPMDRCGLYFAGVDKVLEKGSSALPENVDDGILTAKEISLLDLRDADLVVLSACETGLGDISGEGVFGLQRAFKIAGAQTILMTLWRVNDDATRMLMTAFYRHYSLTHNKRAAFRAAQQEVRARYKDPYYWAGFIMLD